MKNQFKRRGIAVLVMVGVCLTLFGFQSGCGHRDRPIIAVVLPSSTNPFWVAVRRGAEKASLAVAQDYEVMIRESNDQDAAGQVTLLNNFLARNNVAALVLGPASDSETVPIVSEFTKKNIRVVLIDTPLNKEEMTKCGAKMDVFIGSDNKEGGRNAANVMASALEGKGNEVLLIKGNFVHQSAIDRAEGFEQTAKQRGLVVEAVDGEWKPSKAQELTYAKLSRNPVHGIFASNDDMAMGVIQALKLLKKAKNEWPIVIGFDATKDGLQAIENGEMYASIKQNPTFLGEEGVNSAIALLKYDPGVQASRLLSTSVVPDRPDKFKSK